MGDPLDDPIGLEAALASGSPPQVLVPCDVAGLLDLAQGLRVHAAVLDDAGAALSRVEITDWRGRAADGFTDVLSPEPARWRSAADGFEAGAAAVEAYVASIGPARSTAGDAVALWRRYLAAATAAAALGGAPGQPAVSGSLAIGARVVQQQQAAGAGGEAAVMAADADALRRRAIETLAAARRQVQSAGDIATAALTNAADDAPQARRFWESTIRPADAIAAGHSTLDGLGMVPAFGAVPDAVNSTWYAMSGDGVNAAISAAGMVPFAGGTLLGGRILRNLALRSRKLTKGPANPVPELLFIAGSRTDNNLTPRPQDVTGISSYDNLDVDIFKPGGTVQPVETSLLKDLVVYGPDGTNGHFSIRPSSREALLSWQASRGLPTTHPYTQALRDSLGESFKLSRHPK